MLLRPRAGTSSSIARMSSSSAAAAAGGSHKRPRGAEESDEANLARVEPHYEQAEQHALELASGDASDVTLRVGAAEAKKTTDLPFARLLLAIQSPVFNRMLFGGMSESRPSAWSTRCRWCNRCWRTAPPRSRSSSRARRWSCTSAPTSTRSLGSRPPPQSTSRPA